MRAALVVGLLLLAPLASAEPYVAKPLATGQWVEYRERVGGREVGTVTLLVGNRLACGTYFEAVLAGSGAQQTWLFCVDDDHHIVEATLDGKPVVVRDHAAALDALLTRVLPPRFTGTFVTEDVTVPAGVFSAALRKDGATTTWLHPEVPLGAVVRVVAGDREDVLIGFADSAAKTPTIVRASRSRTPPTPAFVAFDVGLGRMFDVDRGRSSSGTLVSVTTGLFLTPHFDAVLAVDTAEADTTTAGMPVPRMVAVAGGPRLWPFRQHVRARGFFDPGAFYVEATAGYSSITVTAVDGTSRRDGVGATAAAGWYYFRMRDWGGGVRVFDAVGFYGGNTPVENVVGLAASLELWIQ